ncbi:SPX domain-containing protein 2 [Cryptomeria japonica]|uniref:SPX domain-containing protein 2 n=1 Tax=Cryptomeria japonica TaxID=3369 RepID=UPI0027DA1BD8|nr:SPX domain-containing protein 2 [Cryptomeria japonica]
MKFEKWLGYLLDQTFPEWRDRYLSYSLFKTLIKLSESEKNNTNTGDPHEDCLDKYEEDFIRLLKVEVDKLNRFMEDKSKDCSIRLQELKIGIEKLKNGHAQASARGEIIVLVKDLVNLHGELVLLENYSVWNYTGLRKILKKYRRRIRAVLGENFIMSSFASETLSSLISECQSLLPFINSLFCGDKEADQDNIMREIMLLDNENEQIVYTNLVAALNILNDMNRLSSVDNSDG